MIKSKRMRICTLLLLVVFTMAAIFTGCGDKNAEVKTDASAETKAAAAAESTAAAAPELEPVDLTWYCIGSEQPDQASVVDEMNKILKEKINATLKLNIIDWGAYADKMKILMAASEKFDLCFTSSWSNDYYSAVSKGGLQPIDELLDTYGKNIKEQIPEKYWDAVKVKGKKYAILNYQTYTAYYGFAAVKELVDKYGFDYKNVKKLQDLEPFLEKVKAGEKGLTPFLPGGGYEPPYDLESGYLYSWATPSWNLPLVINVKNNDYKVLNLSDMPENKKVVEVLRSWYLKGYIRKDQATIKDISAEQKSGKYAMWTLGTIKPGGEADIKAMTGKEVVQIPIAKPIVTTGTILATMTGISSTSTNPERAMMFYDLLYSDKNLYNLLCLGTEGKHYKKDEQGLVEAIADSGYNPNSDWAFGNQFNALVRKGMDPTVWEQTAKINAEAEADPLLGFTFDREPMKNEIAQIEAIYKEFTGMIYSKANIDDYHGKRADKMAKAGFDKVMADVQRQIDEWRAANGK